MKLFKTRQIPLTISIAAVRGVFSTLRARAKLLGFVPWLCPITHLRRWVDAFFRRVKPPRPAAKKHKHEWVALKILQLATSPKTWFQL